MQEIRIRLGAVEAQIDELRKHSKNQADKIQDRVEEAVQPIIDQAQELKESIDDKKFVLFKEIKKSWFKWPFKRG